MNIKHIESFESSLKEFFDLYIEEYPLGVKHISSKHEADKTGNRVSDAVTPLLFGNHPIFDKAIECHSWAASLGPSLLKRFNYIGFDALVSFDNSVDWYNWYNEVQNTEQSQNQFITVYFRLNSEIKRIKYAIANGVVDIYLSTLDTEFLIPFENCISKEREANETKHTIINHVNNEHNYYNEVKESAGEDVALVSNSMNIVTHVIKLMLGKI